MSTHPLIPDTLPGSFTFTPVSYRTDTPAWLPHLPFAYDLVDWLRPSLIVELGTHYGNSYFTMCQSAREHRVGAACYAVDTWQGDEHAERYAEEVFAYVSKENETHYRDFSYLLRMTFDEALGHFNDGTIGLLHIDGFHTYESVRHDFETWLPKVRDGGIVLFHDIAVREKDFGVWKFWEELEQRHPTFAFHQGHGLGVLANVADVHKLPEVARRLFSEKSADAEAVRFYYARCAERLAGAFYPADCERRIHEREAAHQQEAAKLRAELQRLPGLEAQARRATQIEYELRAMKGSRSWQATAPLRAVERAWQSLRRAANRPRRRDPFEFAYYIDQPDNWTCAPASGLVHGWIYSRLGKPIRGVRARYNGKTWPGHVNIPREDVARNHITAGLASGFYINNRVWREGPYEFSLEVQRDDGEWVEFFRAKGRMVAGLKSGEQTDYAQWIEADALRNPAAAAPAQGPLISILLPAYNPPGQWLRRAIESVREQTYPNWELCVADDASTDPSVRAILEEYTAKEPRLKVVYRAKNGHISAASNSALELATGEFTALLDHDDEFAPQALAEIARVANARPDVQLIYTDEDKIDVTGRRFEPYFKPDWAPDLLLGQNYLCHLVAYRTAALREVGGFRVGYEGSQDWDLALRVTERLRPQNVAHIPRVLYHWRAVPGSTAKSLDQKDYHQTAAARALRDYLERNQVRAELLPVAGGYWRVRRAVPARAPKVSLIIPTRNGEAVLRVCIESILNRTAYKNFELIVVDNNSDEPAALAYFGQLREQGVKIVRDDGPFNFSAINNRAVRHATGEILGFLNNDLQVIAPDWLDEMVSQVARPEIGAVGAMLYYPDDRIQHAGVVLGLGGVAGHAMKYARRGKRGYFNCLRLIQNYSAVTAACVLVRREVFDQIGGFDATNLAVAFNDVDFCLRVRAAGYRNLWTPFAELYHHESASRGTENTPEKQARFTREVNYMREKWGPLLDRDPAYNPNLTRDHENFNLAWPPNLLS